MSAVPELPRQQSATEERRFAAVADSRFAAIADKWRYPLAMYLVSRVLYLLVAIADIFIRNEALGRELRNWDGKWYYLLAQNGYPHTLPTVSGGGPHGWSPLGFEPLYSMLMWVGGQIGGPHGIEPAGLLVSLVGGAIATVEISILAERWWGREASRRGILFFCFFPGTIVFSMVYSEGLTLALIAGALICLEDRRWIRAGLLAGAATAVEPVAFAIIPAFGIYAIRELWRSGDEPGVWKVLLAPVLSIWGAVGVGAFMWSWTGTPLAVFKAQRIAWGEKSSPYALYYQAKDLYREIFHWKGISHFNLNVPVGLIGALFMVWCLWWLWRLRKGMPTNPFATAGSTGPLIGTGIPLVAVLYTLFVAFETCTSDNTPPNPRMLICAFPLLIAFAAPRTGRKQKWLMGITLFLLIAMSIGSFAGGGLRP